MPTIRYQIRNEYGLADPELHRAADKDDPEAVLEGVAMAGLVGVLRQLGDLAEFAAEIFHDLHEEVTTTAARGHGLMLRVQQLEAEFLSIEKAFLVQTNHSHLAYNDGTDWHAHLRMNQNLVTQGDMPRFILDSYEECRGPPRLFMLDKFDVAGAGACLKRYSDPSFFKVKFSSSGMTEEEMQWEKKPRKIRKKASHWRNGETNDSFLAPLISSNLQPDSSDQVSTKVRTRRVKLKYRNLLDSDITNRRSCMEYLLEVCPSEQKVLSETSIRHSPVSVKSLDSSGLTTEVHETVIDAIVDSTLVRETYPTESPTRKEVAYIPENELENHKIQSAEELGSSPKKRIVTEPEIKTDGYMSDKAENRGAPRLEVDEKKSLVDGEFTLEGGFEGYKPENSAVVPVEVDEKRSFSFSEFTPEDEYDEYKYDDVCSDLDNYLDALNTTESEVETDSENRVKSDSGFFNIGIDRIDSGTCAQECKLPAQHLEPDPVGESVASGKWNNMLEHLPPDSVVSGNLTDTQEPPEHVNGLYVPVNQDNFLKENPNETLDEFQRNIEVIEQAASVHLLHNETCNARKSDSTCIMSEVGEASSGSYVIDLTSSPIHVCSQGSDEVQSVTAPPDDTSRYAEVANVISHQLDHKTEELSDFVDNNNSYDESMPLSEKGDLSLEKKYISEAIHSAEGVEEDNSEVITGTFDISDHLSETENDSGFEKMSEHHKGEATFTLTANSGEQDGPVREAEGWLDGSVSPTIHELSLQIGPTVVCPEVNASKISTDDVKSSCEAAWNFDNILPHTDSMEFKEPNIDSRISSDDLLLLSDIPGTINSAEDVEPVFSEDMEHIQVKTISDEVPISSEEDTQDIQGKTISDEVLVDHVEAPPVSDVQPGAPQGATEEDNKSCSNENRLGSDAALFLPYCQYTLQPGVRNIVAGGEDTTAEVMEARETQLANIVPLDFEHLSDADEPQESHEVNSTELLTMFCGKETFLDNMLLQLKSSTEDAETSNILMPNIKLLGLGNFLDNEKPQESGDADLAEHLPLHSANPVLSAVMQLQNGESGSVVDSDAEMPKQSHHAASMEHFPLGSPNEIFPEGMQLLNKECGLRITSIEDPQESSSADSVEHFLLDSTNEMFPDKMDSQNKEFGCMMDAFRPVSDTLRLSSGSIASDLNKESLQLGKSIEFDDSLDEYVIVEGDNSTQGCSSVYFVDSSGYDVQLKENYLPHDTVIDQHDIEANESSDLKNSTIQAQNESKPVSSTGVSSSESPILTSFDPSDSKKLDGACCTIPSDSIIDKGTLTYSSENEDYGSKEGISLSSHFRIEPEISCGDGSEANVVSPHSEGGQFKDSDTQFRGICTSDRNHTQSISKDIEDQPSKSEPCVVLPSSSETNELDVSLTHIGTELLPTASSSQAVSEASLQEAVSTQDNSETSLQEIAITSFAISSSAEAISSSNLLETSKPCPDKQIFIASSIHDISETSIQETAIANSSRDFSEAISQETPITGSRQAISEASLLEISERLPGPPTSSFQSQDVDETPPLPPLPPIEWRLGKLRLGNPSSGVNNNQPKLITNQFMELTGDDKYQQGPVITAAMVQPGYTCTSLPIIENKQFLHGSLFPADEVAQSLRLSELPPITEEESRHRSLHLHGEIANASSPFQLVSHIEDVKFPSSHDAPMPTLEDGTTRYPQVLQGEGQDRHQRRPPLGHLLLNLELERSQREASSLAPNSMLPTNGLFVGSSTEEWKHQYIYGVHGGEKHPNLSTTVVARGPNLPPYGFLYPIGESPSTLYDFMIPTAESEKPNSRYRSIRDRPRDPLIEAVAAHDRSTLRKVSELDHPSARLKADEGDSLLEQIKNKSFNLKPANAKKPNIKGVPPTNLKIAAILEKANAIRQACAGSDEKDDDDGDSWSDS